MRAHERNQENIVVLDNTHIVERFVAQFEILKKRSIMINGEPEDYVQQEHGTKKPTQKLSWWERLTQLF